MTKYQEQLASMNGRLDDKELTEQRTAGRSLKDQLERQARQMAPTGQALKDLSARCRAITAVLDMTDPARSRGGPWGPVNIDPDQLLEHLAVIDGWRPLFEATLERERANPSRARSIRHRLAFIDWASAVLTEKVEDAL